LMMLCPHLSVSLLFLLTLLPSSLTARRTEAELSHFSLSEIKEYLSDRGIPCPSCTDKSDYIREAISFLNWDDDAETNEGKTTTKTGGGGKVTKEDVEKLMRELNVDEGEAGTMDEGVDTEEIAKRLRGLGQDVTKEDVEELLGMSKKNEERKETHSASDALYEEDEIEPLKKQVETEKEEDDEMEAAGEDKKAADLLKDTDEEEEQGTLKEGEASQEEKTEDIKMKFQLEDAEESIPDLESILQLMRDMGQDMTEEELMKLLDEIPDTEVGSDDYDAELEAIEVEMEDVSVEDGEEEKNMDKEEGKKEEEKEEKEEEKEEKEEKEEEKEEKKEEKEEKKEDSFMANMEKDEL